MAPTGLTERAPNSKPKYRKLAITSAVVKKGHPTVIKYSWKYDPDYLQQFAVGVVNVTTKEEIILDAAVYSEEHGKNGKASYRVDITELKHKPGKYIFAFFFIDFEDYQEVVAKSKPFHIKRSDF